MKIVNNTFIQISQITVKKDALLFMYIEEKLINL